MENIQMLQELEKRDNPSEENDTHKVMGSLNDKKIQAYLESLEKNRSLFESGIIRLDADDIKIFLEDIVSLNKTGLGLNSEEIKEEIKLYNNQGLKAIENKSHGAIGYTDPKAIGYNGNNTNGGHDEH